MKRRLAIHTLEQEYSGAEVYTALAEALATRFSKGDFSRTATGKSNGHAHSRPRSMQAHTLIFGRLQAGTRANLVNAVDRRPSCNRETFEYLERLLGITVPGDWRNEAPKGRMVVSKYADGLLGGHYRFPTYREGFAACLAPAGHQSMIGPTNEEPTWK